MLIDSHCHLNFDAFAEDRAEVLARAKAAGVVAFINPSTDLDDSRQVVALAETVPNLYAAIGFHPNAAAKFDAAALAHLRVLAGQPKVVAIGEIGLDYHWDEAPRPVQRRVFEQQLALAKELNKPVIIHQREAAVDTMAVLREWGAGQTHPGLVLHSFSGDRAMAEEAIELGFFLGISGPVTFKNARDLPEIVAAAPLDRLLVETDAPFLAPHPFRGKRNEPAHVKLVAERVAALKALSLAEMSQHLTANTLILFKFQPPAA
ncbi:MAG: hydrolase TatD [Anaerolineae bacterium]|nr:TatD family hydrolase [Anaerolineales bacterium]MCQ3974409.1 hydrolase TatD [Anaerolineae bacterium]